VENYQQQYGDQAEPRPEHGGMFQQHGATARLIPSLFACSLCSWKKKEERVSEDVMVQNLRYQHKCHHKLGKFDVRLNILGRAPLNTLIRKFPATHLRGLRAASSNPRTLRHGPNSPPFIVTSTARITVYCILFINQAPNSSKRETHSFRNVGKVQNVSNGRANGTCHIK
jgi:hypothetical protein